MMLKKCEINFQWRSELFLIVMFHFSLGETAFVAASGYNKMPPFLHFPIVKGGTRTLVH
jgi:hypothetical protein